MSESNETTTLEAIRQVVREELDLRLLKTEKLIVEAKASIRRHDNRFSAIDRRVRMLESRGVQQQARDGQGNVVSRSPQCCGCPSFPLLLCPVCARWNGRAGLAG